MDPEFMSDEEKSLPTDWYTQPLIPVSAAPIRPFVEGQPVAVQFSSVEDAHQNVNAN